MNELTLVLPEALLAVTLLGLLVSEIGYHGERGRLNAGIALVGIAAAWVQLWILYSAGSAKGFGDTFYLDGPAFFFKNLFLMLGFYTVLISFTSREIPSSQRSEFYALIIGACLAMSVCASAGDMLVAFLALQAVHLCAFALAGFSRRSPLSVEASVKVLLPGALALMVLLIATAILFFQTQTLNLAELHTILAAKPLPKETSLTLFLLVLMGISFPILSFPMFHWGPDAIQGAPTPVSAFLSAGLRITGFALFLRWVFFLFAQPAAQAGQWTVAGEIDWTEILAVISGVTMLTGSFLALQQKNAKKLVAALIAAETGILLMGVLVLNRLGVGALLYSLFAQLFAILGIFFVLSRIWDLLGDDHMNRFSGLLWRCRMEILGLIFFLICLVGIPPSPGFVGKFALIGAAFHKGWPVLSGIAVISTFLSIIACFRLIYACVGDFGRTPESVMMQSDPFPEQSVFPRARSLTLAALMIPLILMGIFSDWLLRWATQSITLILW